MNIKFSKYHGAGNDFIIINMMEIEFPLSTEQIAFLCDRRFGIGADGLMTLTPDNTSDFYMRYYNSNGCEGTMCGNGGRCISKFAFTRNICKSEIEFNSFDGIHKAIVNEQSVSLSMKDVPEIVKFEDGYFLDTGSPHFVSFIENMDSISIKDAGKRIADENRFAPRRTNVNFVETINDKVIIHTFERGVEKETLACGTGAIATAIALNFSGIAKSENIDINAKGGVLNVTFKIKDNRYTDIVLSGPAMHVFDGIIDIK